MYPTILLTSTKWSSLARAANVKKTGTQQDTVLGTPNGEILDTDPDTSGQIDTEILTSEDEEK